MQQPIQTTTVTSTASAATEASSEPSVDIPEAVKVAFQQQIANQLAAREGENGAITAATYLSMTVPASISLEASNNIVASVIDRKETIDVSEIISAVETSSKVGAIIRDSASTDGDRVKVGNVATSSTGSRDSRTTPETSGSSTQHQLQGGYLLTITSVVLYISSCFKYCRNSLSYRDYQPLRLKHV